MILWLTCCYCCSGRKIHITHVHTRDVKQTLNIRCLKTKLRINFSGTIDCKQQLWTWSQLYTALLQASYFSWCDVSTHEAFDQLPQSSALGTGTLLSSPLLATIVKPIDDIVYTQWFHLFT